MSTYFITNVQVTDREKFKAYQEGIIRTIKPFKGWVLAAGPGAAVEGELKTNHNVIIRFPTMEHIRGWWGSGAYSEIIPLRVANSDGPALAYGLAGLDGNVDISAFERYPRNIQMSSANAWPMWTLARANQLSSYTETRLPHTSGAM